MVLSWGSSGLVSMMRLSFQHSLLFVHVTKGTKLLVKINVFISEYQLQFSSL